MERNPSESRYPSRKYAVTVVDLEELIQLIFIGHSRAYEFSNWQERRKAN
jgi:hypothetical protein